MENQPDRLKPETWKSKKTGFEGKWHSGITMPFIWFEWVCEWVAFGLKRWAFIEILENLGKLSVLVGIILFISESDERAKQKSYQAWQVINTAYRKPGDLGRVAAIQNLSEQGHSLLKLDVSKAYLRRLDIGGNKVMAWGADFSNTDLKGANLRGTRFSNANFKKSALHYADLRDTRLDWADLRCADFLRANLENADLTGAKLKNANFCGANLKNADFSQIKDLKQIYCVRGANLRGVTGVSKDFLRWARSECAITDEIDPKEAGTETGIAECGYWNNLEKWKSKQKEIFDTGDLSDKKIEDLYNGDGLCLEFTDEFRDLKNEKGENYCN